jgi:hypothetical protein
LKKSLKPSEQNKFLKKSIYILDYLISKALILSPLIKGNYRGFSSKSIKRDYRGFFFLLILTFLSSSVFSQKQDSVKTRKHSPTLATVMSAVVPGSGQIYNRKYWKAPIVWVGAGAIVYFFKYNYDKYDMYKTAYRAETDSNSTTINNFPQYTLDNLLELKNFYRKNLELTCFIGAAIYIANVIDAAVDANLFDYDVSDNLSLQFKPYLLPKNARCSEIAGFTLTLNFK